MTVPAGRAAADVLAGYRAAIAHSDRAIRAADGPEAHAVAASSPLPAPFPDDPCPRPHLPPAGRAPTPPISA
jgi:hypothetical protein